LISLIPVGWPVMSGVGVEDGAAGQSLPATIERWLVDLFLLLVFVQFFLAGLAVFRAKPHGTQKLKDSSTFDPHRALGTGLQALALVILIVAIISRKQIWMAAVLFVLMLLQSVWAGVGGSAPAVGGIHVLGGVVILGLAFAMHAESHGRPTPWRSG
jgi:hypothetical protein